MNGANRDGVVTNDLVIGTSGLARFLWNDLSKQAKARAYRLAALYEIPRKEMRTVRGTKVFGYDRKTIAELSSRGLLTRSGPVKSVANRRRALVAKPDIHLETQVILTVSTHFQGGRWEEGWSDEKVSNETGASVDLVVQVREARFGPIIADDALATVHRRVKDLENHVRHINQEFEEVLELVGDLLRGQG